jgi:ABC-type glycerol-3-phosphate transport system substrate-binding protein
MGSNRLTHTTIGTAAIFIIALAAEVLGAQLDWKKDWEQTVAAAKKEGQVTVYIYRYEGVLQDFKREFPDINVVTVAGRGNELTTRVMSERRAGKYIADVYSAGTGGNYNVLYKGKALDPIKPVLTLPEVIDESKWYGKEHRYADGEGK